MSRLVVMWAFALACGPSASVPSGSSDDSAQSSRAADVVEQGAFALVVGGDTTVKEEYTRTDSVLRGTVRPTRRGAKFGWARYEVEFSSGNLVTRARLDMGAVGSSTPTRSWSLRLRDGAWTETGPHGTETRLRIERDVIPVFPPSMVMFHEAIRRALPLRRTLGTARIPVLHFPPGSGPAHTVTVRWITVDTAAVSYNGPGIYFGIDSRGRILGSRPDHFTYVRTR